MSLGRHDDIGGVDAPHAPLAQLSLEPEMADVVSGAEPRQGKIIGFAWGARSQLALRRARLARDLRGSEPRGAPPPLAATRTIAYTDTRMTRRGEP